MSPIFSPTSTLPAIIHRSRKISYQSYDQLINTATQQLKTRGIKRGERVAICSPNCLEYVILLPALWRIGAVSCHFNPRLPKQVIQKQMKKLNCQILLSPKQIISFKTTSPIKLPSTISLDQKTTILFTSGSTSEPKAVVHTYVNHYYSAKGSNENIPVRPGDRWLLSLPLYHVSGLGILFRAMIGGGTVVVPAKKENLITAIANYQITHVSLVTTQLFRLLQDPKNIPTLRKLKAILLGGSAIPANLIALAKKYNLPVYISYGLTEMASQVATSRTPVTSHKSQAKVLNYRQLKIAKDGEILVKGKTLFAGYWDGKKLIQPLKNGWFTTGDLGRMARGYLTVIGRKDNMFISGGENIYPEEIERELLRLPGIAEAIVLPEADKEFGQRPAAFIKGKVSSAKIISHLERSLPRFKIPRTFHAWPVKLAHQIKPQRQAFLKLLKRED